MASCDLEPWSQRIYDNLPVPEFTSSGAVLTWLQTHTANLNAAFNDSNYYLSGACITPTLTSNHSGYYEELFLCQYFRNAAARTLGIGAYDLKSTELDGQSSQSFYSKNEKSKSWQALAKDCSTNLKELAEDLENNGYGYIQSSQILYSERQHMRCGTPNYYPPCHLYSVYNTTFNPPAAPEEIPWPLVDENDPRGTVGSISYDSDTGYVWHKVSTTVSPYWVATAGFVP